MAAPPDIEFVKHNIHKCGEWIKLEKSMINSLCESEFTAANHRRFLGVEDALLRMAAYPKCSEGVFYLSAFRIETRVYLRFFEAGAYKGAFKDVLRKISGCLMGDDIVGEPVWCQVYNQDDIRQANKEVLSKGKSKAGKKDTRSFRPDQTYRGNLDGNATSVKQSLADLISHTGNTEQCAFLGSIVHTKYHQHQQAADKVTDDRWYINCYGVFNNCSVEVEALMKDFPTSSTLYQERSINSITQNHLPETLSMDEQCSTMAIIPNRIPSHVRCEFVQRFPVSGKQPRSLRSKIQWAMHDRKRLLVLSAAFRHLADETNQNDRTDFNLQHVQPVIGDQPDADEAAHGAPHDTLEPDERNVHHEPPQAADVEEPRIRKPSKRRQLTNDIEATQNMMASNITLYKNYLTMVLEHGKLYWRYSDGLKDIFTMNDYDCSTGLFKKNEYVHCSRLTVETGYRYSCECQTFRTRLPEDGREEPEEACLHCRFLHESLMHTPEAISSTRLQNLIQSSRSCIGSACIQCEAGTTLKFSVLHEDTCTFVNISYAEKIKKNIIVCGSGRCMTEGGAKRQVKNLGDGQLCPHLQKMFQSYHLWGNILEAEEDIDLDNDEEDIDQDLDTSFEFDDETGLYSYSCLSTHSATPKGSVHLADCIQDRESLSDQNTTRKHGSLIGPDMIPPIPSNPCSCGAGWTDQSHPIGVIDKIRTMVLYTMHYPVLVNVYTRSCVAKTCMEKEKWDEGKSQCLHVSTKVTCAGDELGWHFLDLVLGAAETFTGFCTQMNNTYKIRNPNSRNFMSPHIFINWWYSWAANQKIDFRIPCPTCKFNPTSLVCDGTKIGITFRHTNVTPIETPDETNILPTLHRRNNRCFFYYPENKKDTERCHIVRQSQESCKFITKYVMGKCDQEYSQQELLHQTELTMAGLPDEAKPAFIRMTTDEHITQGEKLALAKLFNVLAHSTCPVMNVLPHKHTEEVSQLLDHLTNINRIENGHLLFNNVLDRMRTYSVELRDVIAASCYANNQAGAPHQDVTRLIRYLIQRVRALHSNVVEPAAAAPQRGSYNPPKYGRAMYFSPTAEKLRPVRTFSIDKEPRKNGSPDDLPEASERCTKQYPQVGRGGTSYLFLWFCSLHGHCYGFHIIKGSEGRKDPYASLYSHLEIPPETVFYDFACQLHEYCLNRESGYFKDVRVFHDIFHGFSHICSKTYKSTSLLGYEKNNTEIAEQFNGFLQCIKYTAKNMTQDHFVFVIQYLIHHWNQKKTAREQRKIYVKQQGLI